MRHSFLLLAIFIMSLTLPHSLSGQVINTESPYSRFCFGLVERQSYPQTLGMGGIVLGISQKQTMNPFNPAAYPAQDTLTFLFDLGVQGGYVNYQTPEGGTKHKGVANMQHIAFQFPVAKWGSVAVGFQPYSQLGYDINRFEKDTKTISEIGRIRFHHHGSGGLNEVFLGFGAAPHRYISLGLNAHYRFGSINHSQALYIPNNTLYAELAYSNRYVVREFRLRGGVQGFIPCDTISVSRIVIGATVEYSPVVYAENRIEASSFYLNADFSVYQNKLMGRENLKLPLRYGIGAAYESSRFLAGFDFYYEGWREFTLFNQHQPLHGSWELRVGAQYTPESTNLRYYHKRIQYRLGGFYSELPMTVNGYNVHDCGVTLGLGLPFGFHRSIFNLGVIVGHRGDFGKNIVSELYCSLQLGVSFTDFWFFKRKYD